MKKDFRILAIETSCDETSASVIVDGRTCLSNIVSSQIDIHTRFGGVVPEVASRNHITAIDNVVRLALSEANLTFQDIDAIAVTYGAGLVGSLLVGVSYAKALSYAIHKPLIAVNQIGKFTFTFNSFDVVKILFIIQHPSGKNPFTILCQSDFRF